MKMIVALLKLIVFRNNDYDVIASANNITKNFIW